MVETHTFRLRGESLWAAADPQPVPDELAPRVIELYVCPRGHIFEIPLDADVADADIPLVWRCARHGVDGKRMGHEEIEVPPAPYRERVRGDDGRTHYDRLLERRTIPQLEELLAERLDLLAVERSPAGALRATPRTVAAARRR